MRSWRCAGLIALLGLTGCGSLKPDLQWLYGGDGGDMARQQVFAGEGARRQPPLVLVHGVLGARLREADSGDEVWPGSLRRLLTSNYRHLALDIDPLTLDPRPSPYEAFAITDRAAGRDYYGAILHTLESAGGYVRARVGTPPPAGQRSYYVFVYDWRQDNQRTAAALDAYLARIRADHANPDLKVDIVAHSMGGLVTRYFLRYGAVDVLDGNDFDVTGAGARHVRRVVLLGTPNLGSVGAVRSFIVGRPIGLRAIPTEVLVTMPSLYQLFPHALDNWLVSARGRPLDRDVFDIEIWRRFQWSIFDPKTRARVRRQRPADGDAYLALLERYFHRHIERARRFVWSLTVPFDTPLPLVVFGGDCQATPARLLVEEVEGESVLRLWPHELANPDPALDYERLMLEPGDGVVTKASLLARTELDPTRMRHRYSFFPLDYPVFLCEPHDSLTGNVSFQDNLLNALLSVDARYGRPRERLE